MTLFDRAGRGWPYNDRQVEVKLYLACYFPAIPLKMYTTQKKNASVRSGTCTQSQSWISAGEDLSEDRGTLLKP